MTRYIKMLGLVMSAMFVLSAGAASAASAAEWHVNNSPLVGKASISPTVKIIEAPTLTDTTAGVELKCTGLTDVEGEIIAPSSGSAKSLLFTGCEATKPAGCHIFGTEIATLPVTIEASLGAGTSVILNFKPSGAGELFTEPEFEGSCPFVGPQPIKGHCEVLAPHGQEERENQLVEADCSTLTLAGSKATFKGKFEVSLTSKEWFSYR